LDEELRRRLGRTSLIVVLLGAGGRGLAYRRNVRRGLSSRGIIALIPEEDFPPSISTSLAEEAMLSRGDAELVFVHIQSWGSACEFAQFHQSRAIARKLRVLVPPQYHPLHGRSKSYLTDLYLTHLALHGHVYPVSSEDRSFPSAKKVIVKLSERDRMLKAIGYLTK
jgi:hypothetical protein